MKWTSIRLPMVAWLTVLITGSSAFADTPQHEPTRAIQRQATGPHGGSLRQTNGNLVETVVSQAGIRLFIYDSAGQPVTLDRGRGAASLRMDGNAKRYRYDLLPDGKGSLAAPVNLSKIAGKQVELQIQVVGAGGASGSMAYREIASVPLDESQLAAAAIARQKICPVSGKPLGSMGDPVAVDVAGKRVYLCCDGCSAAVKANPAKYVHGHPEIKVTSATAADAALIQKQAKCPVMDEPLGSMGQPIKVMVGDKPIFLCCRGCIKKIQAEPSKYLAMVDGNAMASSSTTLAIDAIRPSAPAQATSAAVPAGVEQVREGVFKVTDADARFIAMQKRCPVMDEPLDAMGGPFKVEANGRAIYICCPGCAKSIAKEPQKYLELLAEQGVNAPILR